MPKSDYFHIGRTRISVTTIADTLQKIHDCVNNSKKEYITVGNLRTTVLAHKDSKYRKIVNSSFINTPDGMPLVWCGRLSGLKAVQRTCGPDLFTTSLKEGKKGFRHFFLGDTQETLNKLVNTVVSNYDVNVVGFHSPDFVKSFEDYNYLEIAKLINDSKAEVIWVALGAPKQDFFAEKLLQYLDSGVIVGVGAAFRFVLGEYKDPPKAFKKLALTGLFWRVMDHPFKSLIWYIKHVGYLIYFMIVIILNRYLKTEIYYER